MVAPQAASSGRCLTDWEREHPATEVAEAEPQAHRVAVHRDVDLLAPGQEDLHEPVFLQATTLYSRWSCQACQHRACQRHQLVVREHARVGVEHVKAVVSLHDPDVLIACGPGGEGDVGESRDIGRVREFGVGPNHVPQVDPLARRVEHEDPDARRPTLHVSLIRVVGALQDHRLEGDAICFGPGGQGGHGGPGLGQRGAVPEAQWPAGIRGRRYRFRGRIALPRCGVVRGSRRQGVRTSGHERGQDEHQGEHGGSVHSGLPQLSIYACRPGGGVSTACEDLPPRHRTLIDRLRCTAALWSAIAELASHARGPFVETLIATAPAAIGRSRAQPLRWRQRAGSSRGRRFTRPGSSAGPASRR